MPHLILEHSANLETPSDIKETLLQLHTVLATVGDATVGACKSRVRVADTFVVGDGSEANAFAHLEVRLFKGRSDELKSKIGDAIWALLKKSFREENIALSIDFVDMNKNTYFK